MVFAFILGYDQVSLAFAFLTVINVQDWRHGKGKKIFSTKYNKSLHNMADSLLHDKALYNSDFAFTNN